MSAFPIRSFICACVASLVVSVARADDFAYMAAGNDDFGVIDMSTGAFTLCGNAGLLLAGLGILSHGALYGGAYGSSTLYVINPAGGALTAIGNASLTFVGFGSTQKALYGLDATGTLYRVDSTSAASTRVGPTGLSLAETFALSAGSSKLFMQNGTQLYTINVKTGRAKLVGAGSPQLGALVVISQHLYGSTALPPSTIYTVDPATGAETQIAPVVGETSPSWGLAPTPKKATGACL